jgi:hypothetical protein
MPKWKELQKRVRPYEEVRARDHGGYNILRIDGTQVRLLFFGCHHIRAPGHAMFGEITGYADELQPDLIFIEGIRGLRRSASDRDAVCKKLLELPLEEVVTRWGESAFTARLALERGIEVVCPEPGAAEEVRAVCAEGFSREAIFGYFIFRMVGQAPAGQSVSELEAFLKPWIDEFQLATEWQGFDYSLASLESIGRQLWGEGPFRPGDTEFYRMRTAPCGTRSDGNGTEINEVSAATSLVRDRHILGELLDGAERAQRVLVVYGSGHSFTLEEALRSGIEGATITQKR